MSEFSSEKLSDIISSVLSDYTSTCGVKPFDGKVVLANDMATEYKRIRGDLVEEGKITVTELNKYHGLTVQPISNSGKFTILLNMEYLEESKTN